LALSQTAARSVCSALSGSTASVTSATTAKPTAAATARRSPQYRSTHLAGHHPLTASPPA
jgi:hypothetical protein